MTKIFLKKEPRLDVKHQSFPYQAQALKSIKDLEYAAVFHEQGLGKTKIAIDLALYWLEKKIVDTVLFITKKALIENWVIELREHSFLKPSVMSQNKLRNYYIFNGPTRCVLANYELMKTEKERMKLFAAARDLGVILDESVKIKNHDSQITKILFELSFLFKRRVIMTGTPVANRPKDIWSQIWFLDHGKSLGSDFDAFSRGVNLSNELAGNSFDQENLETEMNEVFSKIADFTVRETKRSGVIELPQKIFHRIHTTWEQRQWELYCQVRDEMRAIVIKEGIPKEDISENILKRLLRLVQIASNPILLDQTYNAEPGKFPYLKDLVQSIYSAKEKCIIWTSFVENADWLNRELSEFGTCKLHGKMDIFHRNRNIERFKTESAVRILIATPAAAKEGLTLTVANHVIFYDRSFSLDDFLQAQDRIHRISQTNTCHVHVLIMQDSVDEWIDILLNAKELAAQLVQGDISLDYFRNQISYSFGEMLKEILNIEEKE